MADFEELRVSWGAGTESGGRGGGVGKGRWGNRSVPGRHLLGTRGPFSERRIPPGLSPGARVLEGERGCGGPGARGKRLGSPAEALHT